MAVSIFKPSDGPKVSNRHLLCLLFTSVVGAVPGLRSAEDVARQEWKPAAPTATENTKWTHLQQSRRPTEAPRLRGHHALPAVFAEDLRKRELTIISYDTEPVGSNTCGFFTDDASPMYCYPGYTCTNIGKIRDCCAGNDCKTSSFSTVCLDYTDPACSSYSPGTRCCGGLDNPQAAYCATYHWATSENPREIFTLHQCVEKQMAGDFYLWPEKPIFVSDYVPASTSRPPLPIPSSPESTSGSSTSAGSKDGSGSGSGSANGGLNVGAVVGGVIGGVALVGVFLLVFYYMRIRGRKAVAAAAAAAAAKVAAEKGHGNGSDGGSGPYGNGNGTTHMMGVGGMYSPPPPSESFWGGSGSGNGGTGGAGTEPTIGSASPPTVANSTSAMLTPEQQPLVQNQYTPQQMQEWQAFQLQQQYNLFQQQQQQGLGQQGQWAAPQDPRMDVQQVHAMQQQEEMDRGMAVGMAMGMNMMVQQQGPGAKEKSPIEMSNSPTSYEVSTAKLHQELDVNKEGDSAGRRELPG